ncbi:MAG TPA: hypothetical protein PLM83_07250 [Bacillota bacterium]|nr:hypothetical protein [Bacillota bacterium]
MNFERIAVGEPLAGAREAQLRNQTLMLLEWGNSGYTLYVALPNMTEQEAEIIKHNKVKVRMLGEADCLLPVWQFIDSQLFGETPFDPTLYLPYYLDCKEDLYQKTVDKNAREHYTDIRTMIIHTTEPGGDTNEYWTRHKAGQKRARADPAAASK